MQQNKIHPPQNWDISQGDYKRSREDTFTYQKKIRRKRLIKKSSYFILFFLGIVAAFLLIANKFIF